MSFLCLRAPPTSTVNLNHRQDSCCHMLQTAGQQLCGRHNVRPRLVTRLPPSELMRSSRPNVRPTAGSLCLVYYCLQQYECIVFLILRTDH